MAPTPPRAVALFATALWTPTANAEKDVVGNGDAVAGSYIASEFRSGTSMATPLVAGAAALQLGANRNATHQQVRDALVNGATTTANLRDIRVGSPNRLLYIGN